MGSLGCWSMEAMEDCSKGPVDRNRLPLRLIDVKETVSCSFALARFTTAVDWNFHTVSHPWTPDITNLPKKIAERLSIHASGATAAGSITRYEKALEFSDHPFYEPFKRFLRVLEAGGVTKLWFDVLCINQNEPKEKIREIPRMGSYYRLTLGCYICTHGIGCGYQAVQDPIMPPRWFTRVWTVQEFLLAKNVTFIVEKFDQASFDALNEYEGYVVQEFQRGNEAYQLVVQQLLDALNESELQILGSKFFQLICNEIFSQTKVNEQDSEEGLHFVQISDYLNLVHYQSQALIWKTIEDKQKHDEEDYKAKYARTQLYLLNECKDCVLVDNYEFLSLDVWRLQKGCRKAWKAIGDDLTGWQNSETRSFKLPVPPEIAFALVAGRNSTHEEDRVLSVLGLMGLEWDAQVTTGRELREQLMFLARAWTEQHRANLLLNLCKMLSPTSFPGVSWAPDLKTDLLDTYDASSLHAVYASKVYLQMYAAQVLDIVSETKLLLLAKAYEAAFVVDTTAKLPYIQLQYGERGRALRLRSTSCVMDSTGTSLKVEFETSIEDSPELFNFYWKNRGSASLPRKDGIFFGRIYLNAKNWTACRPATICKLWLLLLGYTAPVVRYDGRFGDMERFQIVMVCLQDEQSGDMHKVGTLLMGQDSYMDFAYTTFTKYLLGDLGNDLSAFMFQHVD